MLPQLTSSSLERQQAFQFRVSCGNTSHYAGIRCDYFDYRWMEERSFKIKIEFGFSELHLPSSVCMTHDRGALALAVTVGLSQSMQKGM